MEKAKRGSGSLRKKKGAKDETDEEDLLQQSLKILEHLFQSRLIDRISRPIDKKVKEEIIDKYGEKLQTLHQKLTRIKAQIMENPYSDNGNVRNKSVFGEVTNKPSDWRKIIRTIETKYIEILIDGSFKYFHKIRMTLGLQTHRNMDIINVEEWAGHCLDTQPTSACC